MIAEHRRAEELVGRLDVLLNRLVSHWDPAGPELAEVQAVYAMLAQDLHRHYALEEKALFPVLSQYRTMMLMEVEHDDLLALQQAFEDQLERFPLGQTATQAQAQEQTVEALETLRQRFEAYKTRLLAHMVEEERGIFPLANERLEPEEKLKVLRLTNELNESKRPAAYDLIRPEPGFILKKANLSASSNKPMDYQTLFEREHSVIQTLRLHAGQKQAFHWAGQTQVMVVLLGELKFEARCGIGQTDGNDEIKAQALSVGDTVTLDSRLVFSLSAMTEALLMVFKLWPHPHYTKS
ncbi:MAG TPA: hemerythrin domain-containing protein [Nitrospira sp.]|nr:hemerythrin domain-containing protein [Nitrospira sp.]